MKVPRYSHRLKAIFKTIITPMPKLMKQEEVKLKNYYSNMLKGENSTAKFYPTKKIMSYTTQCLIIK